MKLKKFLVAALTVTMIMGSSSMAFAAQVEQGGEGSGTGGLDVVEQTDIFKVELPTAGTTFNYILDPTGVIAETDAAKYEGKAFEPGKTLYFYNREVTEADAAKQYNYTGTSNKLKVENKSTGDVTIKVNAKLTNATEVTMANAENALATATDPQIFLQLTGDNSKQKAITAAADGVEIEDDIAATQGAYKTEYKDGKYVKELNPTVTSFNSYEFWLTGACSSTTDDAKKAWKKVKTVPEVEVVWTVTGEGEEASEGPTITNATKVSDKDWNYEATFTKGTELQLSATGLTACTWGATMDATTSTSALMTVSQNTLTIGSGMWKSAVAGDVKYLELTIGSNTFYVKVTIA